MVKYINRLAVNRSRSPTFPGVGLCAPTQWQHTAGGQSAAAYPGAQKGCCASRTKHSLTVWFCFFFFCLTQLPGRCSRERGESQRDKGRDKTPTGRYISTHIVGHAHTNTLRASQLWWVPVNISRDTIDVSVRRTVSTRKVIATGISNVTIVAKETVGVWWL